MNNETTDRITEDTNVDEKKILSKAQLPTTETVGAYWRSFNAQEYVYYQRTEDNTYCVEGYMSQASAGNPYSDIYPLNTMILRLDTGLMTIECIATQNSTTFDLRDYLTVNYLMRYQAGAGFTVTVNRLLYATRVTDERIW